MSGSGRAVAQGKPSRVVGKPSWVVFVRPAIGSDVALLAELGARTFRETYLPECPESDIEAYIAQRYRPARIAKILGSHGSLYLIAEVGEVPGGLGSAAGAPGGLGSGAGQPEGSVRLPAGFALLCRDEPPACGVPGNRPVALAQIYVDHRYQGYGVGAALLRRGLDEAGRAGHDVLWLTVWERNGRAIDFYRARGMAEVGETTFTLGSQCQRDLVFALTLADVC